MLLGVRDVAAVLGLFREARRGPFVLEAYEFLSQRCLDRVQKHRGLRPPLGSSCPYDVLLEVQADGAKESEGVGLTPELEAWVAGVFEKELAVDGTLAQHGGEARALWELREGDRARA